MDTIISFKPVADQNARVLVLGSMPGVVSLNANQYYAHPRNAFWKIMADIYDFKVELPYARRLAKLKQSGLALWDVLHACDREGSLDSDIKSGSRIPNDFGRFFKDHQKIRLVGFNGAEAEKSYKIHVLPDLGVTNIKYVRLPSSSPAHAVSLQKKTVAWREVLGA